MDLIEFCNCNLITFTKEIVDRKLHFLCSKKKLIDFYKLLQLHPRDKHLN